MGKTKDAPDGIVLDYDYQFTDHDRPCHIGVVALSTDLTLEIDIANLVPIDEACFYISRVEFINPVTPENLRKMQPHIADAARMILTNQPLASICYGCTSASATLGDDAVIASLNEGKPDTPSTNPALAGVVASQSLNAKNIALLTPYPKEASQKLADYFANSGVNIISHHCLNIADDRDIAMVDKADIIEMAKMVDSPNADAIFLSCTALPAVSVIPQIEAAIGKPVITSNQAMIWMALRLAGSSYSAPKGGKLFDCGLPG